MEEQQWTRFADCQRIPDDAEIVALARSSKCDTGELDGQPLISVFRRFKDGWPEVIGWELFWVVPQELHWLIQIR